MTKDEILKKANEYIAEEKDVRFRAEVEDLVKKEDYKELEDRFYQTLEFGTGGLRGIMGGGTNRMNTLEINRATQGLANYVIKANPEKAKARTLSAVIAYDSRNNSDVFAEATACIFAANGIKAAPNTIPPLSNTHSAKCVNTPPEELLSSSCSSCVLHM